MRRLAARPAGAPCVKPCARVGLGRWCGRRAVARECLDRFVPARCACILVWSSMCAHGAQLVPARSAMCKGKSAR